MRKRTFGIAAAVLAGLLAAITVGAAQAAEPGVASVQNFTVPAAAGAAQPTANCTLTAFNPTGTAARMSFKSDFTCDADVDGFQLRSDHEVLNSDGTSTPANCEQRNFHNVVSGSVTCVLTSQDLGLPERLLPPLATRASGFFLDSEGFVATFAGNDLSQFVDFSR